MSPWLHAGCQRGHDAPTSAERGLGAGETCHSAIVRELLDQAAVSDAEVWLLTIEPTVPFYQVRRGGVV